jgi:hypothetical protein
MTWTSIIMITCNLTSSLLLSSNSWIGSFYWIRGSKHGFLICFSFLNPYFLILVFSRYCYLLVSLCLSWQQGNQFLVPFSHTFGTQRYCVVCAPPYFWYTIRVFSKQDARGNLVLESVPVFFPVLSFLPKISHASICWAIANHTFSSHSNPQTDTFTCDISLR